jgi:hypothetical protein
VSSDIQPCSNSIEQNTFRAQKQAAIRRMAACRHKIGGNRAGLKW